MFKCSFSKIIIPFFVLFLILEMPVYALRTLYAAGLDNMAPYISHDTTIHKQPQKEALTIGAAVSDAGKIVSVTLYYRRVGELQYGDTSMQRGEAGRFYGKFPAEAVYGSAMEYYIKAVDASGNTSFMGLNSPMIIFLQVDSVISEVKQVKPIADPKSKYKKWWVYAAGLLVVVAVISLVDSGKNSDNNKAGVTIEVPIK